MRCEKKPPVPDIRNREQRQRQAGEHHREADAKLRPFQLLLARQMISSDRFSVFPLVRGSRSGSRCRPSQHHNKIRNYSKHDGRSAGSSSSASRYAAAPQDRVTFKPNWIAITIASTDPSTLARAFIAHAHSTAFALSA